MEISDIDLLILNDVDIGILLSTHMLDMAEKFCDNVILLKNGKIVGDGVVCVADILKTEPAKIRGKK